MHNQAVPRIPAMLCSDEPFLRAQSICISRSDPGYLDHENLLLTQRSKLIG
jgi:hypothetical protein